MTISRWRKLVVIHLLRRVCRRPAGWVFASGQVRSFRAIGAQARSRRRPASARGLSRSAACAAAARPTDAACDRRRGGWRCRRSTAIPAAAWRAVSIGFDIHRSSHFECAGDAGGISASTSLPLMRPRRPQAPAERIGGLWGVSRHHRRRTGAEPISKTYDQSPQPPQRTAALKYINGLEITAATAALKHYRHSVFAVGRTIRVRSSPLRP
jgi:hypothetical protein